MTATSSHSASRVQAAIAGARRVLAGRLALGPNPGRTWRVWDLDSEMRYRPVLDALPSTDLPVCEVGSGPRGIAAWTDREVVGVDPGDDDRHGTHADLPNMRRVIGDGAHIPLEAGSVGAAIAVDTFEHIPRDARYAVVEEMRRVTAPGGRVVLMGPTGPDAAGGDARILARWLERDDAGNVIEWLSEHKELGLPTVDELADHLLRAGATRVRVRGVYNLRMWRIMHQALLGDYPRPRGEHLVHHLLWAPFGFAARNLRRGPFYRYLIVGEIGPLRTDGAAEPSAAAAASPLRAP